VEASQQRRSSPRVFVADKAGKSPTLGPLSPSFADTVLTTQPPLLKLWLLLMLITAATTGQTRGTRMPFSYAMKYVIGRRVGCSYGSRFLMRVATEMSFPWQNKQITIIQLFLNDFSIIIVSFLFVCIPSTQSSRLSLTLLAVNSIAAYAAAAATAVCEISPVYPCKLRFSL
jgi:hypothetical protein